MRAWPRHRWIGLAALVLAALAGLAVDPAMFFAAWLSAWWLALSVVMGALANAWVHALTGGNWGLAIRPAVLLFARRLPMLLLLGLPLLAGLRVLYPWAAGGDDWTREMARPGFITTWLSPGFFALRLALYAALWWWLGRPEALLAPTKGRAAASLLVNAGVSSLAAIDLIMSLMPGWYSSAFGLLILTSQMLAGAAACTALAAGIAPATAPKPQPGRPPVWRDLGNLLLAYVMSWAYIAFMQFLIIWAENLPREIAWYLPRLQGGWGAVALVLVLAHFVLPFLALLFRAVKDRPARLAPLAAGLLAAHGLDVAWLVLPSVAPHGLHGGWLVPLCAIGIALLLFGDAARAWHAEDAPERALEPEHAAG